VRNDGYKNLDKTEEVKRLLKEILIKIRNMQIRSIEELKEIVIQFLQKNKIDKNLSKKNLKELIKRLTDE